MSRLRQDTPIGDLTPDQLRAEAARREAENAPLPYTGESMEAGIFRIVFAPVEGEFSSEDAAYDAARHSAWGEDREFENYTVEKVRSTVTPKTHPFICACGECVSKTENGRCNYCGETDWKKR